jgi:hypothetical protein
LYRHGRQKQRAVLSMRSQSGVHRKRECPEFYRKNQTGATLWFNALFPVAETAFGAECEDELEVLIVNPDALHPAGREAEESNFSEYGNVMICANAFGNVINVITMPRKRMLNRMMPPPCLLILKKEISPVCQA